MSDKFEIGKSYPIDTLPDDISDESIPLKDKWSLRGALFWNDCQGWWHDGISDYLRENRFRDRELARFWSPEPDDPMTREAILSERGMVVCPKCDWAITPSSEHRCLENAQGKTTEMFR